MTTKRYVDHLRSQASILNPLLIVYYILSISPHRLAEQLNKPGFEGIGMAFKNVIRQCLVLMPSKRKTPAQLLDDMYFRHLHDAYRQQEKWTIEPNMDEATSKCVCVCVCVCLCFG